MAVRRQFRVWSGGFFALLVAAGCSSRTLVISKDPVINTSNPRDSSAKTQEPQGESLTLSIVGFTADDLTKESNKNFAAGNTSLTSREYYKGEKGAPSLYQEKVIVGAKHDGKATDSIKFPFPAKFFDPNDVIYVFAKFAGPTPGEVLPTAPVKFYPGTFSGPMRVHVGATTIEKR